MFDDEQEEDMKKIFDDASKIAKDVALALIKGANGQGHLITAALAMVLAGLEQQHEGTIKDVMAGAVLLGINQSDEVAPAETKLN